MDELQVSLLQFVLEKRAEVCFRLIGDILGVAREYWLKKLAGSTQRKNTVESKQSKDTFPGSLTLLFCLFWLAFTNRTTPLSIVYRHCLLWVELAIVYIVYFYFELAIVYIVYFYFELAIVYIVYFYFEIAIFDIVYHPPLFTLNETRQEPAIPFK